jgi:hypothetical protein
MRKFFAHAALAVAAIAGFSTTAHARLLITIGDGTSTLLTCDSGLNQVGSNCLGFDAYALGANNLNFANVNPYTVGNFTFNQSTFTASNTPGTANNTNIATNNQIFQANVANSQLVITTTSFGYTLPVGQLKTLQFSSSQNNYTSNGATSLLDGSTQSYGFYVDGTNSGGTGTGLTCAASSLLISNGGCSAFGVFDAGLPGTQPFSITSVQTFNVVTAGIEIQDSTTGRVRATVPEPTSIALVGLALLGAGFASRRVKR